MRLWHPDLLPKLPWAQLMGQHRECCALRGLAWGRKHSTVDYVFKYNPFKLYSYHKSVMIEIKRRKPETRIDVRWYGMTYRGKRCPPWELTELDTKEWEGYVEHDEDYLQDCIENLKEKGITI